MKAKTYNRKVLGGIAGQAEQLRSGIKETQIKCIARGATEKAWLKVNRRIISFESFRLAVEPEIIQAINKAS